MISFPENYFDTEIRCRFKIGKLMKANWAAQLEVLEVLKRVCEKYNIAFFAGFGTLIGTVRHKGFIPWDDDIDIIMKRADYMRFLSVARQELPQEYRVLSMYFMEGWNSSFSRVTNGDRIDTSQNYLEQYHGCPFCVGIDVFPIDYYPRDEEQQKLQWSLLEAVRGNIQYCEGLLESVDMSEEASVMCREALMRGLEAQYEYLGIPVDTGKSIANIRNQLYRIYDRICSMYLSEECDEIVSFQANLSRLAGRWKKEWLERAIPMGYEMTYIPVPVEYDKVLRATFGDYRKPVYHGGGHNYPYYREQLKMLQKRGMWVLKDDIEAGEYLGLPEWKEMEHKGQMALLPESWQLLIRDSLKHSKKVVLYVTSLMGLLRGEQSYIKKLKSVMEIFRQSQGVVLWWIPCQTQGCLYQWQNPALFEAFRQVCLEYQEAGWGIYDDSGDYARAVAHSDAMYGDYGEIYELYRQTGKPIMIQDETV